MSATTESAQEQVAAEPVVALVRAIDAILQDHYDGDRRLDPHHKCDLIDALADLPPHIRHAGLHR